MSGWETGEADPTDANVAALCQFFEVPESALRRERAAVVSETLQDATWMSNDLYALTRRFELELARLGATDEEIDHVDVTLRSEHVAILVNRRPDGSARAIDERDSEFRLQMRALLRWLLMRMEFLNRTPGDLAAIEAIVGAPSELANQPKPEVAETKTGLERSPKSRENRPPPGLEDAKKKQKGA